MMSGTYSKINRPPERQNGMPGDVIHRNKNLGIKGRIGGTTCNIAAGSRRTGVTEAEQPSECFTQLALPIGEMPKIQR